MDRLSAEHLVMCIALILVWLFTVSCCQDYQFCFYNNALYRLPDAQLPMIRG